MIYMEMQPNQVNLPELIEGQAREPNGFIVSRIHLETAIQKNTLRRYLTEARPAEGVQQMAKTQFRKVAQKTDARICKGKNKELFHHRLLFS